MADAPDDSAKGNPLVERVDALLRRHEPDPQDAGVPVLTEVVDDERARRRTEVDAAALEALALELERAVLERLAPEVDRVIEEKLAKSLAGMLGQSVDGMRSELTHSVTQMVREAVHASVQKALAPQDKK